MIRLILVLAFVFGPVAAMAQQSNATRYLVEEQVSAACEGGGTLDAARLIEADLTGDGRDDLVIAHEWIECTGGATRSAFCGMQVCTFILYVREGELLVSKGEFLGAGVSLVPGAPPVLTGFAHGGAGWTLAWTGEAFEFR